VQANWSEKSGQGVRSVDPIYITQDVKTPFAEVTAYEALRNGAVGEFALDELSDLPEGLIAARIAAGWSQRQLAERLGLAPQQIQRYEACRYETASLARLLEVASAMGVRVTGRVSFRQRAARSGPGANVRAQEGRGGWGVRWLWRRRIVPGRQPAIVIAAREPIASPRLTYRPNSSVPRPSAASGPASATSVDSLAS